MPTSRPSWVIWRDGAIVFTSLTLIAYEAVLYEGPPRQALLMLYAGMLGLPAFLRADAQRRRNGSGGEHDSRDESSSGQRS